MRVFTSPEYQKYRRQLRIEQTLPESILWGRLRNKRFLGYRFRRQHSIGNYIFDFYCCKLKLAIELDGSQHLDSVEYDRIKTEYARRLNIQVLRYWNSDVLTNIDGVLEDMRLKIINNHGRNHSNRR